MTVIENVKKGALSLGACRRVEGVSSVAEAICLLLSAQGREFALKTGYPGIEVWRSCSDRIRETSEVFLDRGDVAVANRDSIIVGETNARIVLDNTASLYHIVVMHGAKAEIETGNYAVITVTNIGGEVKIINDGTAVINMEEIKL